jgi:hypothetical protein
MNKTNVLKKLLKINIHLAEVKQGSMVTCIYKTHGLTSSKKYKVDTWIFSAQHKLGSPDDKSCFLINNDNGEDCWIPICYFNIVEGESELDRIKGMDNFFNLLAISPKSG